MTVEIPLTQGAIAIVDDEDREIAGHSWVLKIGNGGRRYAVRWGRKNDPLRHVVMHRQILNFPPDDIDHWDGNGLNNCRSNLRIASVSQNITNQTKRGGCFSVYKGVTLNHGKYWNGIFREGGTLRHIGSFKTEVDAAIAYDAVARQHHGEFGTYNFPRPGERSAVTGLIEPLFSDFPHKPDLLSEGNS